MNYLLTLGIVAPFKDLIDPISILFSLINKKTSKYTFEVSR